MGKITLNIPLTNQIDRILADRGLMGHEEVRTIVWENAIVDTGTTRLCLRADII